jgi:hypothetical protein
VDEIMDACAQYIANMFVGKFSEDEPGTLYLIACKVLEKTNCSTVAHFMNDSLHLLWPE